jgi:hypothetical protein
MIDSRHTAQRKAATPPLPRAFSFTCTCCETTENRPDMNAPQGWEVEYIDGNSYVFCPDCAIDLPRGDAQ